MNGLFPQALKDYIELSQQGLEPVATKEELLALFKKRRAYTPEGQEEHFYLGKEVDWRHVHRRQGLRAPCATMPWDWILGDKPTNPPEGMTIAFLGAHAMPPYILREKKPEKLLTKEKSHRECDVLCFR
jgi:hypothetical protein